MFKARKGTSGVGGTLFQFFLKIEWQRKKRGGGGSRGPIYIISFNFIIKLKGGSLFPHSTLSTF